MQEKTFRNLSLIFLTLSSGCVDAVGYLGLNHVFTANMTGNIVLLGMAIGHEAPQSVVHSLVALAGFVVGALIASEMVRRRQGDALWTSTVTLGLGVECLILVAFELLVRLPHITGNATMIYILTTLLGLAMGMQSNTAKRLGVPGVTTTVITTTLATVIEDVADLVRKSPSGRTRDNRRDILFRTTVLVAYCLGAALAGLADPHLLFGAIWVPICILLCIIIGAVILKR